jgi:hypothetical protein
MKEEVILSPSSTFQLPYLIQEGCYTHPKAYTLIWHSTLVFFFLKHTTKISASEPPGTTTPEHASTATFKTVTAKRPFWKAIFDRATISEGHGREVTELGKDQAGTHAHRCGFERSDRKTTSSRSRTAQIRPSISI